MNASYPMSATPQPETADTNKSIQIKPQKLTYSVEEAAAALGVSKTAMYQIIRIKGFPVVILGSRRLIPIASFERWIEERAAIGWQQN